MIFIKKYLKITLVQKDNMLYLTCPTCGYCLGNKQLQLENRKKNICENPEFSKRRKRTDGRKSY